MSMIPYTPQYINTTENQVLKSIVTPQHWNELFNLLTSQGNNSATALYNMVAALAQSTAADNIGAATITGVTGTTVQAIMGGLKALIDLCYTSATTDSLLALKENVSDANSLVKSITFNKPTGTFTITTQGGTVTTIDTDIEKIATNFTYDNATQSLVLTLSDGTTTTVPLSAFITETEFVDSSTIDFSVTNHTVTANILAGSITDTMLSSTLVNALVGYKTAAETAATNAAASEANALTYKNSAAASASEALASKNAAKTSETNAKASETAAKTSETNAKSSETSAASSAAAALDYKNQASAIVGQKVASFNGRKDVVVPEAGDYTAAMVGAIPVDDMFTVHMVDETTVGEAVPRVADLLGIFEAADFLLQSDRTSFIPTTDKGAANGTATLGADGKVPSGQLPTLVSRLAGTATLATASWVGSSAPYTYALTVTGILATDTPHVDRVTGTNATTAANINTAWALISGYAIKPQTSANTITFYASAKPSVDIPIQYEVVR